MNRFCLILIAAALLISGCATTDSRRIDAWKAVALEEQKSEAAKWKSLEALGQGADPHTKDKLAMAWMAASMSGGQKQATPMPAEPESAFDKTLRALTILAPIAGQVGLGVVQSQGAVKIAKYTTDANTRIAESRDKAETDRLIAAGKANVDIAGKIQAPPGTNIHIGGDGVVGDGTINKLNLCQNTTGTGGNGGNSAPGGAGGENGSGGNNTAGAGAPSGAAPCTIAK
jgi:hypothetical protein